VLFGCSDNAATFDDTWTYDGTTWTLHTPATHPSGRINARMAYDPRRQRVVLFSGQQVGPGGQAVNLADTWEWDGTSWRDVTASSPQPPGRGHHVLQWDPLRERVMLVGGARHFSPVPKGSALGDHWEWNGAAWSEVQVARPPARIAPSLSFDEDRRVMVLYGGFDDVDLGDLWEWNGTSWTERTTLPLPRSDFAFAQQASAGGDAVLFGGYVTGGAVYLGDTHRFSRGAWQQLRGGVAPPPRSTASLAMHADDALLFGGRDRTSTLGDCWLLQKGSADWRQVSGVLPSARRGAAMAYDPERRITVVFGGRVASGGVLADTWIFDGSAWRVAQLESAPDARAGAKLRFDPVRRTLVLLGGVAQSRMALNDAWAFDGAGWTKLEALAAAPTPRLYNAAVFDLWGRLISWGGTAGADVLGDLAVHQGGAWTEVPNGPSARFDAALLDTGTGGYRTVFGSQSDFATRWEDLADVWELSAAP
jgi:hypothetical protein